ncbi:MAG: hypothetical protein PWQ84_1996 [Thermotogaceae bacterium]|jgi:hypothetical protein|nr:hypothetical protein [Thermotogaceae bacterium]
MEIKQKYSHLNGFEFLLFHKKELWEEIEEVIKSIDANKLKTKISKEKTKRGKKLFAPKSLNEEFKNKFKEKDWEEAIIRYYVTDDEKIIRNTMLLTPEIQKEQIELNGKNAIKSFNQTDFVKERIAIEVQFGKYSFVAYDLFVKHLAFYVGDQIDLGIEILPMKSMQEEMSSGVAYYERELYNIVRNGRGVPAVPLLILGIDE